MPRTTIFTIVTKNYIGLINILMHFVAGNGKTDATETFIFLANETADNATINIIANHLEFG